MLVYFLGAVSFFIITFIYFYNLLIFRKNQVDNAFATVDIILQKRCDLIPNLLALAKIYMQFEQVTLTEIARLRTLASTKYITKNNRVALEDKISVTLNEIMVSLEAYPELKSNEQFLQLQYSLSEVEEQISAARRFYNTAVTEYNNAVEMFPTNLIAAWKKYRLKVPFQANLQAVYKVNVKI